MQIRDYIVGLNGSSMDLSVFENCEKRYINVMYYYYYYYYYVERRFVYNRQSSRTTVTGPVVYESGYKQMSLFDVVDPKIHRLYREKSIELDD